MTDILAATAAWAAIVGFAGGLVASQAKRPPYGVAFIMTVLALAPVAIWELAA